MNKKGSIELGPVRQAETKCEKPIFSLEVKKSRFRMRILTLLLPILLAATGCAAGKKTVLEQKTARPPAADKEAPGKKSDSEKSEKSKKDKPNKKKKDKPANDSWPKIPGMEPPNDEVFDVDRLQRDKEYYERCYYNWKCDTV